MAEHREWTNMPPLRSRDSQQSIQSITRKPLNSSRPNTPHRRSTSDNISIGSRSQAGGTIGGSIGLSRHEESSEPANAQRSEPPAEGATGPHSPPTPSPKLWSGGGDLGFRPSVDPSSPNLSSELNNWVQQNSRPSTLHRYPSVSSTVTPRSRPTPFQFEDMNASSYISPAPSSSRSIFSPLFAKFGHGRSDSRTHLLNTPGTTSAATWRNSPRGPPAYWTALQGSRKRWFYWRPAWIMYVLFVLGFAFAVGHHTFYHTLHDRPANDQLAMLRYGTVFAFAAKACLVSAVIVAYRQRIWTTVRSKMLSVAALDSLFAATEDMTALLNLEIYQQAKSAIALAILVWLAPLVIILTGNTLSVEPALETINSTCPGVHSLNFATEEAENWRNPTKINNLFGLSVSLWNSTTPTNTTPGWFDYYTKYSDQFEQIALIAAYGKRPVSRIGATADICGPGWNCTYVVNFTAPGYKCEDLASGVGSKIGAFRGHKPPKGFNTSLLLPEGNHSYYAFTSGGDYSSPQMKDVQSGGMPIKGPPFPEHLGVFRTEPILWIGYAERADPNRIPTRTDPGWSAAFVPKIFACENYETEYTVRFNHTGGQQLTSIIDRRLVVPIVDTQWLQGEDANDGTYDNTTAYPEENYVYPDPNPDRNDPSGGADKRLYRRVAAFHSIGAMVRYFVNGTVDLGNVGIPIADTKAIQTKLLDRRHEWFPFPNLMRRVQSLGEDIVLSLLSDPQFLAVVWAARPDAGPSGVVDVTPVADDGDGDGDGDGDSDDDDDGDESSNSASDVSAASSLDDDIDAGAAYNYPCERSRVQNRYRYHASTLWAVYGVAVLVTALCVVSGTRAVRENDDSSSTNSRLRDTRFSSIVAATRGPALEKVGWGRGADNAKRDPAGADLPSDVKNLKVGYGLVHGGVGVGVGGGGEGRAAAPPPPPPGGSSSSRTTTSINALGVMNNNDSNYNMNSNSNNAVGPASNNGDDSEDARRFPERALWDAREVRYGFGLEGDVSQLRSGEGSLFRGRSHA